MCIIIWDIYKFIGHCLIPLEPWVNCDIFRVMQTYILSCLLIKPDIFIIHRSLGFNKKDYVQK